MLLYRLIISGDLIISVAGVRPNDLRYNAHLTKVDWLIEGIALLGVFVAFAFIAYGTISLPAIVPTHIGVHGIDSYGSKWFHLAFISILICAFYGGITLINRYLYRFYHPTDTNAPVMYHTYQNILRVIKLIIVWLQAILTALYIVAMLKTPEAALACLGVLIVISMMCVVYPSLFIILTFANKIKNNKYL